MAENEKRNERRRSWTRCCYNLHSITLKFLIVSLVLSQGCKEVYAEGNIGCHFVKTICLDGIEFCYDDLVFGRCLPISGMEQEEIERQPLTEEQSRILGTMLEEMQGAGLGWDHPFVQCKIQGALFSLRRDTPLPPNLCANLAPDPEILGPQSPLAFVRFTPPNEDYADEVYFPPPKKELDETFGQHQGAQDNIDLLTRITHPGHNRWPHITSDDQNIGNRVKDVKNRIELRRMLAEYEQGQLHAPIYANNEMFPPDAYDEMYPSERMENFKRNSGKKVETPQKLAQKTFFREIAQNEHIPYNHLNLSPLEAFLPVEVVPKMDEDEMLSTNRYPIKKHSKKVEGVYTEGGLLFVPEHNRAEYGNSKDEAKALLVNMLGFTRHERLDVKKPGPLVGPPPSPGATKADTKEVLPAHIKGDASTKKKKIVVEHSDEDHAPHTVDPEYAHVIVKNPLDNWADGARIVNELANILHMQGSFSHPRVDRHEVAWRVDPNNTERKNASEVATAIDDARVKNNIYRRLGVTLLRSGVGDKVKSQLDGVSASRLELAGEGPDVTHIMAYMFAGAGAAAVIVIAVTLFLIRRHDKKRDKLGGLTGGLGGGGESCTNDYQDLCRARMSGKGNSGESAQGGRVSSLSKEHDRPPSSRSSTSSWSEEPALTNMDISTGHMVLSYMEDHLRNKGRLQREWEALCRYEAEPSARDAALQPQCSTLNRTGAPLPYDHSRVVLNHLANSEGLDYINASTITDHDPRAPAYVAAQGPLPTTLAHFWQMIWEQGAVVIVALCRLQENGEIACARYWPEEGAEVYHIYEVHLVSEHIWCDDYLVRSFYLKNLRTSETRTVTQFHFLSWPQNGVPSSAKALLDFRRKVNKSYRGRSCPIVVHGNAGAGRTGAYILLDLVLGRMNKGAKEIDIAATLEHLRDQRAGLVATRQQFEFVLMAVAEEVHAILKNLPANQGEKRELEKEPVKEEVTIKGEKDEKDVKQEKCDVPENKGKDEDATTTTKDGK